MRVLARENLEREEDEYKALEALRSADDEEDVVVIYMTITHSNEDDYVDKEMSFQGK